MNERLIGAGAWSGSSRRAVCRRRPLHAAAMKTSDRRATAELLDRPRRGSDRAGAPALQRER